MDMSRRAVRVCEKVFEACSECIKELEVVIPDYYPEVMKIVRTEAIPMVRQNRISAGKLSVEGNLLFVLLYQSGDGKGLCSYTCQTDFTHIFELPSELQGNVRSHAKTEYVSCKLLSSRKGILKAVLGVYTSITAERQISLPAAEGEDILLLTKPVRASEIVGFGEKFFKIAETGELDAGQGMVGAPLRTDAFAMFREQKIINNKVIAKGELNVRTLYVTDDDRIDSAAFVFPFSQIVDVDGVDDGCDCSVKFGLCDMNVNLTESVDGSRSVFEYDFTLSANAVAMRTAETELICDAFNTGYEMTTELKTATFEQYSGTVRGTATIKQRVAISEGITDVCDVTGAVRIDTSETVGAVVKLSGGIDLKILCLDGEAEIISVDKSVSFDAEFPVTAGANMRYEPEATIQSVTAEPVGENELELKIQLYAEIGVYMSSREEYLSDMHIDESRAKTTSGLPVVSVYFATAGEPVWDIAKRYNVSPARIRELNGVDGNAITETKRLLLPRRCR